MPTDITAQSERCYTFAIVDSVGARVRAYRKARGLTQRALADRAGLYHTAISELELGKTTPMLDTIKKIAAVLEVDYRELLPPLPPQS